jgi:lipoprotein-releasing system permease protein
VKNVRLTLERQALVSVNGSPTRGALLRGVRAEDLLSREIVTRNIVTGELGAFSTRRGVVMGDRLRQSLNARIGDTITIVTHKVNETGTVAPRYSDYPVLAAFLTKRYEFDSALVFLPLEMLQDDLEYDHRAVTSIDLELTDPASAPKVAADLRNALGRDDLKVADWQALNARFVGALQVERVMMFIILSLIVVVAALNVVASFTMLVRVKRGNIAILRTMGAMPGTIVRAFFMAAAAVSLAGTLIGAALGLLICANMPAIGRWLGSMTSPGAGAAEVDFVTSMPVRVEPVEVLLVIAVAVALALVAAAYPAWRSARVEPVEGLRHE